MRSASPPVWEGKVADQILLLALELAGLSLSFRSTVYLLSSLRIVVAQSSETSDPGRSPPAV